MSTFTMGGGTFRTFGELPAVGSVAPDFRLTGADLQDVSLASFAGKTKILSIVPSLDTRVCAASTRRFNEEAAKLPGVVVLVVSADLPFAMSRFCGGEKLTGVTPLSMMRGREFGKDYGILIMDGPFEGVCARSVVVVDGRDRVSHTELVPDIGAEPDYERALAAARG